MNARASAQVMLQYVASSYETWRTSDIWEEAWGEVTNYG